MEQIRDTFGLSRVVEPSTAVPVTTWKMDNNKNIGPYECRLALTRIHLERANFRQLCSECDYSEARMTAKVMDIINRRGKLENPFTNSAGLLAGTIEEMGTEYEKACLYQEGDAIICLTTMSAHPLFIETIHRIDYDYGDLEVSGYAIIFYDSPITTIPRHLSLDYTMTAFDEAGSLYNIYHQALPGQRYMVIGRDLISAIFYTTALRNATNGDCYITVLFDKGSTGTLSAEQLLEELYHWSDSTYVLSVINPVETAGHILKKEKDCYDLTINCEDLQGSEALGVFLTRHKGILNFTGLKNGISKSLGIAESMRKELNILLSTQFIEGYDQFTFGLLESIAPELDRLNHLFAEKGNKFNVNQKKSYFSVTQKGQRVDDFIFASPAMELLVEDVLNIAAYDCNVIIQGETGVGKEKVLSLLHKNSERKGMACVKINCATIQENLAESEMFGYEAGSFTGARDSGKKGYFEVANGGILFLDEVGALSLNLQSKLLRVLQENQFYRVGGTHPINTNVRVICANNVPLYELVEKALFREDLYYRLNICTVSVPPLREHKEDIGALATVFLKHYIKQYGKDKEFEPSAFARLAEYNWPGNVRELENVVHRAYISVRHYIITDSDIDTVLNQNLSSDLLINIQAQAKTSPLDFNQIIQQQEKQLIQYALKKCRTTREAATLLNMSQPQLMRKKQKYRIDS